MLNTSLLLLCANIGVVTVLATFYEDVPPGLLAVFVGVIGSVVVQVATSNARRTTPRMMIFDVACGGFLGFVVSVLGPETVVGLANKWLKEDSQIVFQPTQNLGWLIIVSFLAGTLGDFLGRKWMDRWYPGWEGDGTGTAK